MTNVYMNLPMDNELVDAALRLASDAHSGQYRKMKVEGAEPAPYITHPIRVASLLWDDLKKEGQPGDEDWRYPIIAAALCHDVLEDTDTRLEAFEVLSEETLKLVLWLTINDSLKGLRKWRKFAMRETLSRAPAWAKVIKLADRWDNLKDFEVTDPGFLKKKYAGESAELVLALDKGMMSAAPACQWEATELYIKYRDLCVGVIERNTKNDDAT